MADILIRGMEMPSMAQAYKALILPYYGNVYEGVYPQPTVKKKEPIANAVELPEHGDLIDRKALTKALSEMFERFDGHVSWNDAVFCVLEAPIVVSASKEAKQ